MSGVGTCWLCGRALGTRIQWHYPVPKAKGGRDTVAVHPICHRAVHTSFTYVELALSGGGREILLANQAVAKFVEWVSDKLPDFHAPTRGRKK